jgi:hypothetical protein
MLESFHVSVPGQTPSNTVDHHQDPVFRAMSALAKQGLGWEDVYVRLTAGGFQVTRSECRRFVIPKARRPGGASGALCRLNGATPDAER